MLVACFREKAVVLRHLKHRVHHFSTLTIALSTQVRNLMSSDTSLSPPLLPHSHYFQVLPDIMVSGDCCGSHLQAFAWCGTLFLWKLSVKSGSASPRGLIWPPYLKLNPHPRLSRMSRECLTPLPGSEFPSQHLLPSSMLCTSLIFMLTVCESQSLTIRL